MAGRYSRYEGGRSASAGDPTRAGLRVGRLRASVIRQDVDLRDRSAQHPITRGRTDGGFRRSTRSHTVAANLEVLCAASGPAGVEWLDRCSRTPGGGWFPRTEA